MSDDRQRIECPECGRTVFAVPGVHTMKGGAPDCHGSHIPLFNDEEIARLWEICEEYRGFLRYEIWKQKSGSTARYLNEEAALEEVEKALKSKKKAQVSGQVGGGLGV